MMFRPTSSDSVVGKQRMTLKREKCSLGASTSVLGVGAIYRSWHWARMYHFSFSSPFTVAFALLIWCFWSLSIWEGADYGSVISSRVFLVSDRSGTMGKLLSKIFGKKEMRMLMLGLDAAGKTSEVIILCSHVYSASVLRTVEPLASFFRNL